MNCNSGIINSNWDAWYIVQYIVSKMFLHAAVHLTMRFFAGQA